MLFRSSEMDSDGSATCEVLDKRKDLALDLSIKLLSKWTKAIYRKELVND